MYDYKTKRKKESTIGISFDLDADLSKKMTKSAHRAGRTKRMEAKLRLEDHIKRFEDFSKFIDTEENKED